MTLEWNGRPRQLHCSGPSVGKRADVRKPENLRRTGLDLKRCMEICEPLLTEHETLDKKY